MADEALEGSEEKRMTQLTLVIADRPYPLKVEAESEADIRKIVKKINDTLVRFQQTYSRKDKQDCLALTLLSYAIDLRKAEQNLQQAQSPELSHRIDQLDQLLQQLLNNA